MDDLGFPEFNTPQDLYVKLKHDYTVLKEEPNCSNYLNFILMVNCLIVSRGANQFCNCSIS